MRKRIFFHGSDTLPHRPNKSRRAVPAVGTKRCPRMAGWEDGMNDETVAGLVDLRRQALVMGSLEGARALEQVLRCALIKLTDGSEGTTGWRRIAPLEDAAPNDPSATIRGNLTTGECRVILI